MGKVQLAMLAWQYRNQILAAAACLLLLPFLLIGAIVAAFVSNVPMVSDQQITLYMRVVADLKYPDGQAVTGLRWQSLAALDAVRHNQDFSRVTEQTIRELAQMFIMEIEHPGGQPCANEGEPHCKCKGQGEAMVCLIEPHTTYDLRTGFEVADLLGFTPEQRQQLNLMASVEPSLLCEGFLPNPLSNYVWPAEGRLSSCFGEREAPDRVADKEMHWGVDIAGGYRSPVKAAYGGRVHLAGSAGNYGLLVIIISDDTQQTHFWYGHLDHLLVTRDQVVQKGDVIGLMGTTGRSTGVHLHFEARPGGAEPVNPLTYYD